MTTLLSRELTAPPERAPDWVHRAWKAIEDDDASIKAAALAEGHHVKSLRYWIIDGEAERQTASTKRWRGDNPERTRLLSRNAAAREDPKARLERARRWRALPENRSKCTACGGMMAPGSKNEGDGVCMVCRQHESALLWNAVITLARDGYSNKEIAARLDCRWVAQVRQRIREAGVEIPRSPYPRRRG